MEFDHIPSRMRILSARGLAEILTNQGKPVPEKVQYDAAWDLDDALDSPRRKAARAAMQKR